MERPDDAWPLIDPPRAPRKVALVGLLAAAFVVPFLLGALTDLSPALSRWAERLGLLGWVAAAFLLAQVWTSVRVGLGRSTRAVVRLHAGAMEVPQGPTARRAQTVPYASIRAVALLGDGPARRVLLDTADGPVVIVAAWFDDWRDVDRIHEALRERIEDLPDGHARLVEGDRLLRTAARLARRPTPGTMVFLIAIGLAYLAELATGALDSPYGVVRLGANVPALVAEGEVWRLVSCNFLHGGALHILLNGMALWFLGVAVERLLGTGAFVVVSFAAGVAGALASGLASVPVSVGASAAIFGLLGAFGWLHVRFNRELPPGTRQTTRWWIFILGINAALPLVVPIIDWAAHTGGFAAGVAATWLMVRGARSLQRPLAERRRVRAAAAVCLAVTALGLAQATVHAVTVDGEEEAGRLLAVLLDHASEDPATLNNMAWTLTSDRDASPQELEAALRAAEKAHALDPDEPAFADTLATAHYRLGHLDEAVRRQQALVAEHADPMLAGQLARFLAARQEARGPSASTPPAGLRADAVVGDGGRPILLVSTTEALAAPVEVHLVLGPPQGVPTALVRLRLGARPEPLRERLTLELPAADPDPGLATRLVGLDPGPASLGAGAVEVQAWPVDPDVYDLP